MVKDFGCKYGVPTTESPGVVVQQIKETNQENDKRTKEMI